MSCKCCAAENVRNTVSQTAAANSTAGNDRCTKSFWPEFANLPRSLSSNSSNSGTVTCSCCSRCARR